MSVDENKAVVRRLWEEVWNAADLAVADAIFAPEYAAHERGYVPFIRAAFPDSEHTIEAMIGERDIVVTRFLWRGSHRGEFLGLPATGKRVAVRGLWMHRLDGGRIVEGREWGALDWLAFLDQIGAVIALPGRGSD
jgi:steroid delta-isomerase-like uncharacterized protein